MIDLRTHCSHAFASYDHRMRSVCCRSQPAQPVMSFRHTFAHEGIQQLRQDLLSGKKNPMCDVCWNDEAVGLESTRQKSLRGKSPDQLRREVLDPHLKWIWVDTGNNCNLACRTCSADWSTTIGVEHAKRYDDRSMIQIKRPSLEPIISEDFSYLEHVMILGGEPFLDVAHHAVLDSVIQQGNAKNCTIIYVTNNSKPMPDKIQHYLDHFKEMIVILSVDATAQAFEYIRTGANWDTFEHNHSHLRSINKDHGNLTILFNITVGVLNCLYLDPLHQWIHSVQGLDRITMGFVVGADHYSFNVLDDMKKQKVIASLEGSSFDFGPVINHVRSATFSATDLDAFWRETGWTKQFHDMDIDHYLPELMQLLTQG